MCVNDRENKINEVMKQIDSAEFPEDYEFLFELYYALAKKYSDPIIIAISFYIAGEAKSTPE